MNAACRRLGVLIAVLALHGEALAEVPTTLSVQGVLREDQGGLQDGVFELTLRLYRSANGSAASYEEVHPAVEVRSGVFVVELGSISPLSPSLFRDAAVLWLGISVGDEAELPTVRLSTVPYAFYASYAEAATNAQSVGGMTAADIQPRVAAMMPIEVTGGSILSLSTTGCGSGFVWKFDGAGWKCELDGPIYSAGTGLELADGTFSLAADGITAEHISAGSVEAQHLAASGCVTGQMLKFDGTQWLCAGDDNQMYLAGSGLELNGRTFSIAAAGVDSETLANGAVRLSHLGVDECSGEQILRFDGSAWVCSVDRDTTYSPGAGLDLTGASFSIEPLGVTSAMLANDSVSSAKIAADTIVAGDIATGAVGTLELANDAVTSAKIAAESIVAADIAMGAVGPTELAANAVTGAHIAADTITAVDIATGAVGTLELAADAVTSARIAADTIVAADIATGAVGSAELGANAVTTGHIAADTIVAADIATGAVNTAELASGAVTGPKIATGAVDTVAIAADAVTNAKILNGTLVPADFSSTVYGGTGAATTVARSDHTHSKTCPAGYTLSRSGTPGTVLCIRRIAAATWSAGARACFAAGAFLCTLSQLEAGCDGTPAFAPSGPGWLGDRTSATDALRIAGTPTCAGGLTTAATAVTTSIASYCCVTYVDY